MDASGRMFRLLRAIANDQVTTVEKFINQGNTFLDDRLNEWEKKLGLDEDEKDTHHKQNQRQESRSYRHSIYPQQLIEDLQLFNLKPPSNWEEVKNTRKREMKKFHPDKYMNDPDKMETAKKIVQIYNGAYERLKDSFNES